MYKEDLLKIPVGGKVLAGDVDGSQKSRSALLAECGYRKDHHTAGIWVRMSTGPYVSDYRKRRLMYHERQDLVSAHIKKDRTYTNADVRRACGLGLRADEIAEFMTALGWRYEGKYWRCEK